MKEVNIRVIAIAGVFVFVLAISPSVSADTPNKPTNSVELAQAASVIESTKKIMPGVRSIEEAKSMMDTLLSVRPDWVYSMVNTCNISKKIVLSEDVLRSTSKEEFSKNMESLLEKIEPFELVLHENRALMGPIVQEAFEYAVKNSSKVLSSPPRSFKDKKEEDKEREKRELSTKKLTINFENSFFDRFFKTSSGEVEGSIRSMIKNPKNLVDFALETESVFSYFLIISPNAVKNYQKVTASKKKHNA